MVIIKTEIKEQHKDQIESGFYNTNFNIVWALALCIQIIAVLFLVACNNSNKAMNDGGAVGQCETPSYPLEIKDSYNRNVVVENEPLRIVSLAPNITEIIFALGKSSKLVGRTEYCDYPEDAKKITSVGGIESPNFEQIALLRPDILIASSHFKQGSLNKLEELGIKVIILKSEENFEGVYKTISKIGLVINAAKEVDQLISEMKNKIQIVLNKTIGKPVPSVYYIVEFSKYGDFTAGGDTFISQMINLAQGKNAAQDVRGWRYNVEKLIEKNPDILICSKYNSSKERLKTTDGYKELNAVICNKVYEIDNNLLDRQGPRLVDGLMEVAKIIHPEINSSVCLQTNNTETLMTGFKSQSAGSLDCFKYRVE